MSMAPPSSSESTNKSSLMLPLNLSSAIGLATVLTKYSPKPSKLLVPLSYTDLTLLLYKLRPSSYLILLFVKSASSEKVSLSLARFALYVLIAMLPSDVIFSLRCCFFCLALCCPDNILYVFSIPILFSSH